MQLSREFFDALIIVVILIGLALAIVRLYADFTRPLPSDNHDEPEWAKDDTQPKKTTELICRMNFIQT
ncbi:MAG TPA: hypothetical protein VHO69_10845 [Phototrophicaceae bacterium]|nr:hypothetical protein [Phototrophicaceae bacterium]